MKINIPAIICKVRRDDELPVTCVGGVYKSSDVNNNAKDKSLSIDNTTGIYSITSPHQTVHLTLADSHEPPRHCQSELQGQCEEISRLGHEQSTVGDCRGLGKESLALLGGVYTGTFTILLLEGRGSRGLHKQTFKRGYETFKWTTFQVETNDPMLAAMA